jgi:prolyl-tRNA synthetase
MLYSKLIGRTNKSAPADEVAKNAQLLIRAGFINKEMAGVYAYLPLGLRVIEKIKTIIREEMNIIGGQEIIMSSLQPKELWEKTGRWDDDSVDVWFKSKLKSGAEVGFGWSHEEPITEMMKRFLTSYRDFPAYVYQFQTKLRNELRAKSGLMRGREFVMKDLYSYDTDEKRHLAFYESVKGAYMNVFKRVGLGDITYITFAAGGAFTKYSHEFQTIVEVGEDTIYVNKEKGIAINEEVLDDAVLKELGVTRDELTKVSSAEVGNIFNFGTSKCDSMKLYVTDEKGSQVSVFLGSYGIGVTRLMGLVTELFADDRGLIWPKSIAPYTIHLVGIDLHDGEILSKAQKVYTDLSKRYPDEVLFDDRVDTRAGEKFADADLVGCPIRVVVSKRTEDQVEVKRRTETESKLMSIEELNNFQ